ncbi:PREDICTED: uncharacterized protein LOC109584335 [Amphimedon queenslandica]|uniref:IgGFc-binding protein N-terminal domain-containing protein n=1 Tax=Amphimedon queenslandica TaxID=400682 RepID=A0AAN0JEX6_AMPQE|nr:PREDICTED: uncharacterized protein LOC109584335 [Amphimedon queenslandica]|eukprot:XP_019855590.1 PREDICTED: uncharacterized protein LOC109584335 [Amphimedon queenslandica]
MSVSLVCLFYFFFFTSNAQCLSDVEECTERFMELPLVSKRAGQIGTKVAVNGPLDNEIRILRGFPFNCPTNITSLILGIDVRVATGIRTRFPSVQLFRISNNSNNMYSVVAESERIIYYSTSNVSTSGVFEYPLDPPISVQNGDNLAISQPDENESIVVVHYIGNMPWVTVEFPFGTTSYTTPVNSSLNDQLVLVHPIITDTHCVMSTVNETAFRSYSLLINEVSPLMMQRQIIYPEIEFYCNGSITKWIYGATINDSNTQQPELQIWRQTSPSNYIKVGSSSITMSNSTIHGSNVFEFIPKSPLSFQEGDIFGVFNPPNTQVNLHEQEGNGPLNLIQTTNLYSAPSTFTSQHTTVKMNFPLVTVEIQVDTTVTSLYVTSSKIQDEASFSSVPVTFSSVYFTTQSVIQSVSIASAFSTAMSTESINIQSTQNPMSFTQSLNSQTSVTSVSHTSSIRRPISQSDSVSISSTSGTLISSSVSITGSSTSNPQESLLPAIAGGLVGIIVLLLLLLALCAIVVIVMMFRSKKKKNVALGNNQMEAQYEEVGPRNELSFHNELYHSVESQGPFEVPSQYSKLNFTASSDTNQSNDNVPFYTDISQSNFDDQINTMKNLAYREVNYDEDCDMIDNPLYESEKKQMN